MAGEKAKRSNDLLLKAAQEFEKGNNPFCDEWLSENGVTLDECFSLSERIAVILKGHLASSKDEQMKCVALGAVYGESPALVESLRASLDMQAVTKKLKALR